MSILVITQSGINSIEKAKWDSNISLARRKELDPLVLELQRKIAGEYSAEEVEAARLNVASKDKEINERYPKPL
ncbi:hypothetical protein NI389_13755 [Pseudoalteromonas xiamenensis]|uniref:hypothetical protein n=1 Tax=Pseudoalteromonas xiamenensis TaxID=882626 RepID=UPI0027E5085C|nr:hypothetical protein [Pseudoalteromonas xiamenensis]WMN59265.1 hypothetical protein NI389_13755 [Pseudoalteromonas xiamenensis]